MQAIINCSRERCKTCATEQPLFLYSINDSNRPPQCSSCNVEFVRALNSKIRKPCSDIPNCTFHLNQCEILKVRMRILNSDSSRGWSVSTFQAREL